MNDPEQRFAERYALWLELHRCQGPGRSYAYAWRLPELARPLGSIPFHRAQHALALDLYTLGRFPESLAALPEQTEDMDIRQLRARLGILLDLAQDGAGYDSQGTSLESLYLAYLADEPHADPLAIQVSSTSSQGLWISLLRLWSRARAGHEVDLAEAHQALARLRLDYPCLAAQGEALLAESVYWQGRAWSNVWLDHALDQVDGFSQHHLKARLLGLKARALAACGDLGESHRFHKLAANLAARQGAQHYRHRFVDEPEACSP